MNIFNYNGQTIYLEHVRVGVLKIGAKRNGESTWFSTVNVCPTYEEQIKTALYEGKGETWTNNTYSCLISATFNDTIRAYLSKMNIVKLDRLCYDLVWGMIKEKMQPIIDVCVTGYIRAKCKSILAK